ncbi:hypothetical protein BGW42_007449 [Actinomortierella wolfii]|nr:hypothetical protein BGW42_007449 [Actinomortierella wolfii]
MLEVQSILDDPERDVYHNITHLRLEQPLDVRPDDLIYLLHRVLPKLQIFETSRFESCTGLQVVEATRDHKSLGYVHAPSDLITDGEREDVGLYLIDIYFKDPYREVIESEYVIQFGDEDEYYRWA